jgi:hypothetical protein
VLIDNMPRREVLRIRLELMIRACDDIQREIAKLDRLDGAPPAKQRRGLPDARRRTVLSGW